MSPGIFFGPGPVVLNRQGIKTKTALGSQVKSPPSPCPLLVKNLLAHLAQSSEEPRRGLVGFACAARIHVYLYIKFCFFST